MHAILIEGCDCTGKTTLAQHVRSQLRNEGWDILAMGHRLGDQCRRYINAYSSADRILFDRGHFSEIVYGEIWRGGTSLREWERIFLDEYALSRFVVVLSFADPNTMIRRRRNKGEQQIRPEEMEAVQDRFVSVMSDERVIRYNSASHEELEKVTVEILARLRRSSNRGE